MTAVRHIFLTVTPTVYDYNSQTRSGSGTALLAHNDARLWSSPVKSRFRKLARYNRQAAPNRLLLHYLSVFANSMLREFTRELACILWIGTEVQTANRTFVLTTPTASAITNYHDGPQAHFLDGHVDSVRLQLTDEKRLWNSGGKAAALGSATARPSADIFRFQPATVQP
jgi:hypothetical protein